MQAELYCRLMREALEKKHASERESLDGAIAAYLKHRAALDVLTEGVAYAAAGVDQSTKTP